MLLAPVAVLPLGLAVTAIGLAGDAVRLPPLVTGLLAVGLLALGSRAFHLDGVSDTFDGLTASYDRGRSLDVMKTGAAGPAGVVALVVLLGLQSACLATLLITPAGAVLAGITVVVSRCALSVCCARGIPSARPGGLGHLYAGSVPRRAAAVPWLLAILLLTVSASGVGLPIWRGPLAGLVALLVIGVLLRHVRRRLGGVTGDVFGGAVELSLTALLVVLA
jgi:adenosylcobinamide-GDP ribazoletransferase